MQGEPQDRLLLPSLLGIGFFLLFVQVNAPSLDVDSIHYASVAKEIARAGCWLHIFDPVVNGPHYFHFPLGLWVTAFFFKLLGVSPAAAKLYSLLMALAAVGGIFLLGRTLKSAWVGWFAGMAFLLTNHVLRIARQCRLDLPLIGFLVWAFVGLALAQTRSRAWYLLLGLGSLGAIMTKEMIGLVPLVVAVVYLVLQKRWKDLIHPAFLAAWALAIGPVLGWIALEQARYGSTLWYQYYHQNFLFLMQAEHLKAPWYYYGWAILDKYWYFLPLALAGGWMAWNKIRRKEEPRWLIILLWAAAFPLGFSLSKHKLHYYILPMYAATALLVGLACERIFSPLWRKRILWFFTGAALLAAVGLACFPAPIHRARYEETVRWAPQIDVLFQEAPGEMLLVRQDAASLLFYSEKVHRITHAHDWPRFGELLAAPADHRRYALIAHPDWQLLPPETRSLWAILLDDGRRFLIKREAGEPPP